MARWSCAGPNTLTNSRAVRLDPSDNKILAVMMGVTHYKLTLRLAGVTRVTSSLVGVKSSIHLLIDSVLWAVNGGFGSRRIKFSVSRRNRPGKFSENRPCPEFPSNVKSQ